MTKPTKENKLRELEQFEQVNQLMRQDKITEGLFLLAELGLEADLVFSATSSTPLIAVPSKK